MTWQRSHCLSNFGTRWVETMLCLGCLSLGLVIRKKTAKIQAVLHISEMWSAWDQERIWLWYFVFNILKPMTSNSWNTQKQMLTNHMFNTTWSDNVLPSGLLQPTTAMVHSGRTISPTWNYCGSLVSKLSHSEENLFGVWAMRYAHVNMKHFGVTASLSINFVARFGTRRGTTFKDTWTASYRLRCYASLREWW